MIPLDGDKGRIRVLQFISYIGDIWALNKTNFYSTTIILPG